MTDGAPYDATTKLRRVSYGQTGQDILLEFLLLRRGLIPRDPAYRGTYVDIGCNHARTGSNSFYFYERGWSGVCVDADPDVCAAFAAARPRDRVVNCGIGDEEGSLDFYIFHNSQHNTFNAKRADKDMSKLREVKRIAIRTMTSVLQEAGVGSIDFMSVDIEGMEMKMLAAMDFHVFRPKILLMEALRPLSAIAQDEMTRYLKGKDYELIAHTGHDAFYAPV
jgi:FkbM family methyltransferase